MVETIEKPSIRKVILGKCNIVVSNIALGTLPFASYRNNKKDFLSLVSYAYSIGINLIDTAEIYDNYELLGNALRRFKDIFVITKSYAVTKEDVDKSLLKAKRLIGRDIDIFLLHEQESSLTIKGHIEALEYLNKLKEDGDIRATGISTHKVSGVRGALEYSSLIDIVMTILNFSGLGIIDGSRKDMEIAVKDCYNSNIGIIGMKVLGGGHLLKDIDRAFTYIRNLDFVHSFLIGVEDAEELEVDINLFNDFTSDNIIRRANRKDRYIEIEPWCTGCGVCIDRCSQRAISIVNGKARVDREKCVLCSYCAQVCPDFSIKVV